MTRKRVETDGGGSGNRRDRGIARRWACRRVQAGQMRCIIHISFTLVKFYVLTKCVKKNTFLFSMGIFQ